MGRPHGTTGRGRQPTTANPKPRSAALASSSTRGQLKATEDAFQRLVIEYAPHFRPGRTANGSWRTPVEAGGKGFPDLVLLRDDEQLVVELKADNGRLTPEQEEWIEAFQRAGVEAWIWRPRDWDPLVLERLRRRT